MKGESSDWEAVYEETLADRRSSLVDRPTLDDALAFGAGELSPDRRRHLFQWAAVDSEIAHMVQDVMRFSEGPRSSESGEVPAETDEDQARRWQQFQERLRAEPDDLPSDQLASFPHTREHRPAAPSAFQRGFPLAASFFLGALLAAGGSTLLGPPESVTPLVNLAAVQLLPDDGSRTRADSAVELAERSQGLAVTLISEASSKAGPFQLEARSDSTVLFTLDDLQPHTGGLFHLSLPRELLSARELELVLSDGRGDPIANYRLQLTAP